ncbi:GNAT family N-acetyltransferase [Aciduricibacillus chroicocephali]|uniref:GNAT family N-acetyltransferase n=1 Tax=Aciduricibacillus chroicocephali TaxID=3054939 RepID=A0ABY9KTC6_9BACI|nr:GNAT family N-acetyltransferase [Bacillaceae bacterium 44XB]
MGEIVIIKEIDISDPQVAKEVLSVQIPSYQVEAELIKSYDIPPLNDTIKSLQQSGEFFYGYYINEELCGVISLKINKGILDIHRLFVHPNHFRKGIAKLLLEYIQTHLREFETITVSTGSMNIPAINFYKKSGFTKVKEIMVDGGLSITLLEKKYKRTHQP